MLAGVISIVFISLGFHSSKLDKQAIYDNLLTKDSLSLNYESVLLQNNETYLIKHNWLSGAGYFGSSTIIGFDTRMFSTKPFLIRSYEQHESQFELLTNYATDNLVEQLFYPRDVISGEYNYLFYNYTKIHSNSINSPFSESDITNYNYWRSKLGDDPDHFWWRNIERYGKNEEDISMIVKTFGGGHAGFVGKQSWPLVFFHSLIKEKVARDIIAKYIASSYKNVQSKIPLSIKTELLEIMDDLITFIENDITKGKALSYFESFLVRRIDVDKVPISELKSYLRTLRNVIFESTKNTKILNLFLIEINNDILLKDYNINDLIVTSRHSGKEIIISQQVDDLWEEGIIVKCLEDKGVKYYQFERKKWRETEFLGLYDSKLELLRAPTSK